VSAHGLFLQVSENTDVCVYSPFTGVSAHGLSLQVSENALDHPVLVGTRMISGFQQTASVHLQRYLTYVTKNLVPYRRPI